MARELGRLWGNLRYGVRIVSMDGEQMDAEGENPDRIGFVVERDRIVQLVWG